MAFFIIKYFTAIKEKYIKFAYGLKKLLCILLCNASKSKLKININFISSNIKLSQFLNALRKYPIYIVTSITLVTGLTWTGYEVWKDNSIAENKRVEASEMHADSKDKKWTDNKSLASRKLYLSDAEHPVGDLPGIKTSRGGLSRDDARLLAMVIEGEAAGEPMTGKVAVGAVILNRAESGDFPQNVKGVIYQPWAFESVMNGQYTRPLSRDSIRAAEMAIGGWDPTDGALYFWNPVTAKSKWVWQKPITKKIGRHVFAK